MSDSDHNDREATVATDTGRRLLRISARGKHATVVDRAPVQLGPGVVVSGTSYEIVRWLGDYALGSLYEARDTEHDRLVTLEVLRSDVGNDLRAVRRARAEARVANDLRSPHIPRLFSFSELSDGRIMMAREPLQAHNLAGIVGRMDPARLIAVLRQLCKALTAAHSVGIVHGDIKPENVYLVHTDGREELVKLAGFGVASLLDAHSELGRTAGGTPYYLAPERWRGGVREPASDLYAVGCLAYEVLTGSPPFIGDLDRILHGHLTQEPASMGPQSDYEIPSDLERVIGCCLEKDPRVRFGNAVELEAALCEVQIAQGWSTAWDDLSLPQISEERRHRLAEHMPRTPDVPQHRSRRTTTTMWRRRRRRPLAWVAGVAVVCIGSVAAAMWGMDLDMFGGEGPRWLGTDQTEEHGQAAVTGGPAAPPRHAEPSPAQPEPVQVEAPRSPRVDAGTVDEMEREAAAASPASRPSGRAQRLSERADEPRGKRPGPPPEQAEKPTPPPAPDKSDPATARSLTSRAHQAFRAGERQRARRLFHRALGADGGHAPALIGLSDLYFDEGAYAKALQYARKGVSVAPHVARYRVKLGDAYYKTLRYEQARTQYRKAIEMGHAGAKQRLRNLDDRIGD